MQGGLVIENMQKSAINSLMKGIFGMEIDSNARIMLDLWEFLYYNDIMMI